MDFLIVLLIAISLSFDTFAISISSGLAYQQIKFFEASKIAITLAFFQTMMPLAGWGFGEQIRPYIEPFYCFFLVLKCYAKHLKLKKKKILTHYIH